MKAEIGLTALRHGNHSSLEREAIRADSSDHPDQSVRDGSYLPVVAHIAS